MRKSDIPKLLAANTKIYSFTDKVEALAILTNLGQNAIAIAIIVLKIPGPNIIATIAPKIIVGNDMVMSVTQIIILADLLSE